MIPEYLFKVSAPKENQIFYPKKFWRSFDWTKSSSKPQENMICEELLYAGEFYEIAVHLLPSVLRVMIPLSEHNLEKMKSWNISYGDNLKSVIFTEVSNRSKIEVFTPTVHTFSSENFCKTESGEFVSSFPQTVISHETWSMPDAIVKWKTQIIYVDELDSIFSKIRSLDLDVSIQD